MTSNDIKKVTLGEISKNGKGNYGIGASAVDFSDDLYTYLRITDINDDGTLNNTELKSVNDPKAGQYLLQPNDIVFARTGNSTGRSYFYDGSDGELVYAGFLIKFSLDPSKVNPKYIRYYTLSNEYKGWVSSYTTGSTRGNINAKTYANMQIPLPPREQQDYLVKVLSSIDEKIETNIEINNKLEKMAESLFKHWFVNFEFPNESGHPYKSNGGEMVESEIGNIPKEWKIKSIGNITSVNIGKTPPRKEKQWFSEDKGDYRWISIKDLGNSKVFINNSTEYLTREAVEKFNVKVVPDNTLILSFKLTVGRIAITIGESVTNEAIAHFKIKENDQLNPYFLYLYLKDFNYQSLGNTSSIATAINSKIVRTIPVLIPDGNLMEKFKDMIEPLFKKIKSNVLENEKLKEIRDTLLPKLMSGEISVPNDV